MRSCNRNNGNNVTYVNSTGNCTNNNANNGNFAAPDSADIRAIGTHGRGVVRDSGTGSLSPVAGWADGPREQRGGDAIALVGGMAASAPDRISIEDVIGYDALWESMERCRRGVMWKGSVQSFVLNAPAEIGRLCDELHDGTYQPREPRRFTITSPKRREIVGVAFRDRVVQRSYNDNAIYPCMSRSWIYDNYACQTGKGTDFARDRMRCHLARHHRRHGRSGVVLTIDVRGYYDSLLLGVMDARFREKCPAWAAGFAHDTIARQYGGGRGVNPGSQLVQIAGVDYLDLIDHAMKERMGVRGYGRYMDDLVMVLPDDHGAEACLREARRMLALVGLEAHERKTRIRPLTEPFGFLGFDFALTRTGHVRMTVRPDSVRRMRRRVSRLARLEHDGLRPVGTAAQAYAGWRAHAAKGDSTQLLARCDRWFKELGGKHVQSENPARPALRA